MDPDSPPPAADSPPTFNYILSFLLVGLAWGFTTPFMRRAAVDFNARNKQHQEQQGEEGEEDSGDAGSKGSGGTKAWLRDKIRSVFWTVVNLLRTPAYLVPLLLNLTGSVWFFLLVGKHGAFLIFFLAFLVSLSYKERAS